MEQIVKSLRPMSLAVAAAVVFVLGTAFLIASDATLTPSSLGASSDLAQAARWLQFLAAAGALAAVCTVGWDLILRSEWAGGLEIAAAALGTLLITVGLLAAAASNGSSTAAPVIGAVGIGIWALLVLSRAARTSLDEKGTAQAARPLASQVWLASAVGLFVLAIGYGLTAAANSRGPAVVAGLLEAIGVALLAGSVAAARSRGWLRGHSVPAVLAGLSLLTVWFLAAAIVAGLALGTLTAQGAGLGVVAAIELAAFVVLGLAAWTRLRELYRSLRVRRCRFLCERAALPWAACSIVGPDTGGPRVDRLAGDQRRAAVRDGCHGGVRRRQPAARRPGPGQRRDSRAQPVAVQARRAGGLAGRRSARLHRAGVADAQPPGGELGGVDAGDAGPGGAVRRAGRRGGRDHHRPPGRGHGRLTRCSPCSVRRVVPQVAHSPDPCDPFCPGRAQA